MMENLDEHATFKRQAEICSSGGSAGSGVQNHLTLYNGPVRLENELKGTKEIALVPRLNSLVGIKTPLANPEFGSGSLFLDVGLTSRSLWFAPNANIDAFNIRRPLDKEEQSLVEVFAAIAARSYLTQGEWVPHIGEEKNKQVKNFLGFGKKAADELSGPEEAALLFAKNRFIPNDLGEAATDTIEALETRDRLNPQCEFEKGKASSKGEPVAGRYTVIYDVEQPDDGSGSFCFLWLAMKRESTSCEIFGRFQEARRRRT